MYLFNAEQKGLIGGFKEFGKMFGRALKFIVFQDKIYKDVSVVEGAYTVVYTNPVSAYNAATAALDGGWSASALGITSWTGRVGQGLSKVIEWIAN